MNTKRMRYLILSMAGIVMLAGLTGCPFLRSQEFVDQSQTITHALASGGQLYIDAKIGNVTVSAWDQNTVSVTYQKRINVFYPWLEAEPDPNTYFDDMDVTFDTSANTPGLTVREDMPVTWNHLYSPSIDLDIKVPAHVLLTVAQQVGNVDLDGVHGALDITASIGKVTIHHPLPMAGETIKTAVQIGDTALYLPESSAFDVDAVTQVGQITADDFWSININAENITGAHATGHVNGGGADVTMDADTGDIAFLLETP